jgi:hypothetical protein
MQVVDAGHAANVSYRFAQSRHVYIGGSAFEEYSYRVAKKDPRAR